MSDEKEQLRTRIAIHSAQMAGIKFQLTSYYGPLGVTNATTKSLKDSYNRLRVQLRLMQVRLDELNQ